MKKIWITEHTYQVVYKKAHLKPIEITRCIAARTQRGNRYYYHGIFKAPADAWSIVERDGEKVISCHINRKLNRHFDPVKIAFNDKYENKPKANRAAAAISKEYGNVNPQGGCDMNDLVKRLRIKAGMIEMGERIAWGSDSALMREAADALEMAAPAVQGEAVAYAVFAENGNIRIWNTDPIQAEALRLKYGEALQPLYAAPQPVEQQPDVARLVEALEWIAGVDCKPGEGATDFAVALDRGFAIGKIHRKAAEVLAAYRKGGQP